MAEINNNIPSFGINLDQIKQKNKTDIPNDTHTKEEKNETKYVPDTGVLGRSQVKSPKGGNINKSVDEAVALAKNNPVLLGCSEGLFDNFYRTYIESGMEPSEAYMQALLDEEEFLKMGISYNR